MKNTNKTPPTSNTDHYVGVDCRVGAGQAPASEQIQHWARNALSGLTGCANVDIAIIGEQEMRQLNAAYRGRDTPTNVLAFPADETIGTRRHLGDIAVCASVVRREAKQQGKAVDQHWAHLVTHGILHLLGFDHIQDQEAVRMEAMERSILARLGIPDPY